MGKMHFLVFGQYKKHWKILTVLCEMKKYCRSVSIATYRRRKSITSTVLEIEKNSKKLWQPLFLGNVNLSKSDSFVLSHKNTQDIMAAEDINSYFMS